MIIYYHKSCIDGTVAAWLAWLAHDKKPITVPVDYRDTPDWDLVAQHDEILILDFSFAPQHLPRLCDGRKVRMYDHHQSAIDTYSKAALPPTLEVTFDTKRSGAMLAYDHFIAPWSACTGYPSEDLRFVATRVDDRDRWVFRYPETKPFNRILGDWCRLPVPGFDAALLRGDDTFSYIVARGQTLLDADETYIESAMKNAWLVDFQGYRVPFTVCPPAIVSETLNRLAKAHAAKWAAGIQISRKGLGLTFRSTDDGPNVAKIAESLGGGGHPHASGCPWPAERFAELMYKEIP